MVSKIKLGHMVTHFMIIPTYNRKSGPNCTPKSRITCRQLMDVLNIWHIDILPQKDGKDIRDFF